MAYVPDPTDVNQPTDSVKAGTADDEFRALKAYIQGLVLGAVSQGPTVRQCALAGSLDSSGDPNFLSAGTGLALDLAALDAPLVLTYAAGSGAAGDINYSEAVGADATDVVTGLQPGNLSYITKLHNGAWGKTLAPCQYGKIFDPIAQLLVRWPGINNAVTTTEDFGNTITFAGNAKISTGTLILGENTLACDGTGDYVSTPFTSAGSDSWEVFGSFRTASLAATQTVVALGNAAGFGMGLYITNLGKLSLFVSSTGIAWNVANAVLGTTTIVINTTYFYRLVFDALAGTYRVYLSNNGAAEVQESTTSSALLLCAVTTLTIGADITGAAGFNGNIGFTGFRRFASFTSAQVAGPTVAPTFADVKTDFFNTQQMKMYEITAASTVAGTNPTMAAVNKLYLAEALTSAVAVTGVANYAFKGKYVGPWTAVPAALTAAVFTHNIGVSDCLFELKWEVITGTAGYVVGDSIKLPYWDNNTQAITESVNKRTAQVNGGYLSIAPANKTSGVRDTVALTSVKFKPYVSRSW